MDEYLGIVKLFAGSFAPKGWLMCNGQVLSVNSYAALYSLLGTTYGGDGQTTFNLPDLRGRVPAGAGPGPISSLYPGDLGGANTIKLNQAQLPPHVHPATATATGTATISVSTADATEHAPVADTSVLAAPTVASGRELNQTYGFNSGPADTKLGAGSSSIEVGVTVAVGSAGAAADIDVRQPFIGMNYIICIDGIYPSRP